jgi:hypothetical protein
MLTRPGRAIASAGLLFLGALAASQCSKPASTPAPVAATPGAQPLLGDMKAVVSVKELMQYMIDPIADNIFDAVWTDINPKGVINYEPKTDEDWDKVKTGAVTLAEGIYLLKVPRPFTPPGDVNNSTGPNPPELSPTQIKAKLDKDPVLWNAKIEALRNVALEVMDVVKKKDVNALFEASEDLDEACEACHLEYWYPGDKDDVERDKLKRVSHEKPRPYLPTGKVRSTIVPVVPGTKQ